jgi:hypothetical protein
MAINISQISPQSLYPSRDISLIQSTQIGTTFNPSIDYIEYVITTPNKLFKNVEYNYNNYAFPTNGTVVSNNISDIDIDPIGDINRKGYNNGDFETYYNFYRNQLQTSPTNQNLIIKSISADRTELKLDFLSFPITLTNELEIFKSEINNDNSIYINEFYLNFGNDNLVVANNFDYDPNTYEVIVNLATPLSTNIVINTSLWIVTKIADSLVFAISLTPESVLPSVVTFDLQGPNFNISLPDKVNNTTDYVNYSTLLSNTLTSSINQIESFLAEKSIEISIDYTNFSDFIHFSSAYQRLSNFYYKVKQIEDYNNELNAITNVTSSLSSSIIIQDKIKSIIKNFDGYEYYMYYESGSYTWPKSNNTVPYTLYSTGSTQALTWFGSATYGDTYYGGRLLSASLYDENNQDYLYYAIPEYLRDDERNAPYYLFVELVGQHYDSIWTYYKDVTNRYNADNRLDFGISKDLVAEALKSFGVKIYQNNFTSGDLFNAFTGFNTGSTGINLTPTGSDLITEYVTASYEASVTPIDDYNKEIYKRIYHNLPYLAKTKGTIPGLRALINCFGVPDTVLRISEFGGRDKDTSTYDYFDQQFNYAFDSFYDNNIGVNWLENTFILHPSWSANNNRPESIQLRFKTAGLTNTYHSQSIFLITSGSGNIIQAGLTLLYTGSGYTSASYSGSTPSASYQFAKLDFYPNTSFPNATASVYLPFFNEGWWSVMVNRSGSTYTLYAGNSLYYDGYDGNQIGYLASSSITTSSLAWPSGSYFTLNADSFVNISGRNFTPFTGSYQELRFWARTGSVDSFKDFIMNPQSIDYSNEIDYANYLAHRLPLGADLITTTSSLIPGSPGLTSVHPKVTGSWPTTQSFSSSIWGPNNTVINIGNNPWYVTNVGPRFLNSPVVGLKGRVTDKIQIVSSSLPTGSVISQYISIEQSYPSLGSESPDVNLLEVAFSPQNEINDDVIESLGYFNIGEYIGDPRQVSSSATSYPDLNVLSNNFFQKYFDTYDLTDYVRLIKYFDNSLFKMIKDFVPARTSLTSGVVIKQHLLERNKYPQPQVYDTQYQNLNVYSSSLGLSSSFNYGEDLVYTGSINTAFISGSTGGTFNQYNTTTFAQDWVQDYTSSIGVSYISHSSQDEFYNGELPGTEFVVTNGELNSANDFKLPSIVQNTYTPTLYVSNITPLSDFLDINTSPNQGEIYLWFDTGSFLNINPPGVPTAFTQG